MHPDLLTAVERIAEIGDILARGFVRLRAGQSSSKSADRRDSCLDFFADQRGHALANRITESHHDR
jgi:hypothetical protein